MKPLRPTSTESPVFVCRDTAARRLEISVDTFDVWVKEGFIPKPTIDKGQIKRWHWPTIEARLSIETAAEVDPFIQGVRNAAQARQRTAS